MAAALDLTAFRRHGGRLAAAQAAFPDAPTPWLDLSTGVNPHPYPAPEVPGCALHRLPDPDALTALEAAAAAAFGAAPEQVAAVPGSEAAIRVLPRLLAAPRVALAADTYASHAEAWRALGAEVGGERPEAEAWVVVNPNNPDGSATPIAQILASARRRWTIVDEAFADAQPALSVAGQVAGRLIVLRSFGKFHGLPGVRLGFVIAASPVIDEVRALFGDWPVSAHAIAAGRAAYADLAWAERTRVRLNEDAARLDTILTDAGLSVIGGTPLFRLAACEDAEALFIRLARAGVLVRPFEDGQRTRFGLPARAEDWPRLVAALAEEDR